jgi:uncharacterized protein YprB with RNaseH-like and TPR domain
MATAVDKFARLSALRPLKTDCLSKPVPHRTTENIAESEEECMLARVIGATVARTKFGSHLSVRSWHATPEFCAPSEAVLRLLTSRAGNRARVRPAKGAVEDGRSADCSRPGARPEISPLLEDAEKWLFLDTETTGISGGTGTYAFLIGIAWWDSGGLEVEQFLMRDFSEEHSVLHELAGRLAERPVLVTFNGKTFDWPLLESRYVMTRAIQAPQLAAHLDLLHPARALWKLRLGSVRLVELEEHVLDAKRLGWDRADDVPSNMIPQFYFDYLRGRSVAPLAGVVRHNRNDLRGLAALFAKLNAILDSAAHDQESDGLDLFGLSRYLNRRGEAERAELACVAARERGLPISFDAAAQWDLAKLAKRRGGHDAAAAIWRDLARDEDWKIPTCEALATYYDRQQKDLAMALDYARQALLAQGKRLSYRREKTLNDRELKQFERLGKRVARLELRLSRRRPRATLLPASQ